MNEPTHLGELPEDEYSQLLRAALRHEAEQVRPGDRFAEIWAETHDEVDDLGDRGRPGTFRWLAAAAVAAIAIGVALPLAIPRLTTDDDAASAPTPTPVASSRPPSGPPSLPTVNRALAVYYLDHDQRLTREFRDLPTQSDRLTTAVAAVLNVAPLDPNYRSLWSAGQVNSATVTGTRITLDLSASAFGAFKSREDVIVAIRQVVYSATAAVGDRNGEKTVQVLIDGSPNLPMIGARDTDFTREGVSVLAPVLVSAPAYGLQVAAQQPFTISGEVAQSLTAGAVIYEIYPRSHTSSVSPKPSGAGQAMKLGQPAAGYVPFSATTSVAHPGEYVVRITAISAGASQAIEKVIIVS